ncbi:hypothetical protein [uncultured Microscilla sp.]|uniref:hypothetical protein n=1 Tax=uncultured Microscilla sp. TaxID=432653 RepID=UPI00263067D6|nr:hypothetical protein [uncultured Microscilla sp.]
MANLRIEDADTLIVFGILLIFGILDAVTGLYHQSKRTKDDWLIEVISITIIAIFIKPGAAFLTLMLGKYLLPDYFLYYKEVPLRNCSKINLHSKG